MTQRRLISWDYLEITNKTEYSYRQVEEAMDNAGSHGLPYKVALKILVSHGPDTLRMVAQQYRPPKDSHE